MAILLKTLTAILTLIIGILLGLYLLAGFVPWKITLWALACSGLGQLVYSLLRAIDKRYKPQA